MNTFLRRSFLVTSCLFAAIITVAQDSTVTLQHNTTYDPHYNKIIPDKVFEFGIPLLMLYLIANTIISIYRIKEENRLKEKAMDKGISEATLILLFSVDQKMARLLYLKWFLVLAAVGIALIFISLLAQYIRLSSGYLALGFISLFISVAFLIYYRIIRKH